MRDSVKYFPKGSLDLCDVEQGARMWGVALDKVQLTYFEVEPSSRFEMHAHESEQITMVLTGELFFETGDGIVQVGEGEVIAIPSNVPHAVFTKERSAKALDAWSPILDKYLS